MFLELIETTALLLALSLLQGISLRALPHHPRMARVASGIVFGAVCVVGMLIPIQLEPGVIVDGRSVVLSMAGLFAGPVPSVIAGAIAAGYRIALGGSGMFIGAIVIAIAVALGLLYRATCRRGWTSRRPAHLFVFGLLVHALSIVLIGQVPGQSVAAIYDTLGIPYLLIMATATLLLGLLLDDLENRLASERALAEREARLRAIAETVPDILFVIDEHGRYLEVMTHRDELLYVDANKIIGRQQADLLPAPVAGQLDQALRKAVASHATVSVEYVLETPGGTRNFEARMRIVEGETRPHHVVTVVQDITDRALVEQERRIAAIAFESQQGMLVTDAQTRILRVNRAFTEVTGYAAQEVIGKPASLLSSGRHGPDFYKAMWQALETHDLWEGEIWNRRRNGEVYPERLSIGTVRDASGAVTHYVGCFTDISHSKASEEEIRILAYYDHLTGLPNRRLLTDRLRQALAHSRRTGARGALIFIDLDDFKNINDLHGHQAGDMLLTQAAMRLRGRIRESDTVARFGGDEFVVLIEQIAGDAPAAAATAEQVAGDILHALGTPYLINGRTSLCTASIGIAMFSGADQDIDALMQGADLSMYESKRQGKNQVRFFDPAMQHAVAERLELETDLREALAHDHFELHFQAQCDAGGRIDGVEALARWRHPTRGMVPPDLFIQTAERCGAMPALGRKLFEMACVQLGRWAQDPALAKLRLSVNVSAIQLYSPNFVSETRALLARTGCPADHLLIELTESMLIDDIEDAIATMDALREIGIRFSIDDFGTGYSSLAYLQRLPLDELKIDRSFIQKLPGDASSLEIVKTIIALARTLELRVIAEGVETRSQLDALIAEACSGFQGFLFHRPETAADFETLMRTEQGRAGASL